MGAYIEGIDEFSAMIFDVETRAKRQIGKKLVQKATRLQKLARAMAPVEFGGIEESIKVNGDGKQIRNDDGTFGGIAVEVYIDDTMPAPGRPGVAVGQYVYEMHEHLTPAGGKQLGLLSQQKERATGIQVGGGFMDRAAGVVDGELDKETENWLDALPETR